MDPAIVFANTQAEPRPYQQRVVQKVCDFLAQGGKSVLVNSPTGSGKTVMGLAAAKWLQDKYGVGVAWVAARRNLLSQVKVIRDSLGFDIPDLTTISMFDSRPPKEDGAGRPIRVVIGDESQHDAASSMVRLYETIQPQWVLGLSATPYRTDNLKLCFQKVIQDAGIHQLIQHGYLSPYHQYVVPEWTPETVVERFLSDRERWGKSVMYWLNEQLAQECLHLLQAAGVRARFVHGRQSLADRERDLHEFESGDVEVLVNMFILTEGWDCSPLKTVWVRDSQRGPTIQMAGRVFRRHIDHPFKQVVQSRRTRWPMQKTATPQMEYVWSDDGTWRSVKPSKMIERVACRAILDCAKIKTEMPEFIEQRKSVKKSRLRMLGA